MKRSEKLGIANLIGIVLVALAVVSAGGLFYLASEYSKISETLVSVSAEISDLRLVRDAEGAVHISVFITVYNPSKLDIEISRIECNLYLDNSLPSISHSDRYVGAGSVGGGNGTTVNAGMEREVQVSLKILPATSYMDRLDYADSGEQLWAFARGFLWFRISDYSEATKDRLPIDNPFHPVVIADV